MHDPQQTPSRIPWDLLVLAAIVAGKSVLVCKLAGFGWPTDPGRMMTYATAFLLVAPLGGLSGERRARARLWLNGVLTVIFLGDVTHALYFQDIMSMHSAGGIGGLGTILSSITAMVGPGQLLLVADLVLLGLWRLMWRKPAVQFGGNRYLVLGLLTLAVAYAWQSYVMHKALKTQGMFLRVWSSRALIRGAGTIGFHLHDTARFLKDQVFIAPLDSDAQAQVEARWSEVDDTIPPETKWSGVAEGANVIVLMIESLQEQALGAQVRSGPVMPNLDALAAESIRFTRFYHQTAQGRTADAEAVTLCGIHPLSQGAVFFRYPDFPQYCLPEILRDEAGYVTASFHAMSTNFWNRAAVGPRLGFERMMGQPDYRAGIKIGLGLGDDPFLRQTARMIDGLSEPFFAHVITLTSHHPYSLPRHEVRLGLGSLRRTYLGRYFRSVNYVDRAVGRFIKSLRRSGLLDRSILIVLGDHDMGRLSGVGDVVHVMDEDADTAFLPRVPSGAEQFGATSGALDRLAWMRQVPLLIRLPGGAHAGDIATPTGQIQLPAAVLDLLGLPVEGRDFLASSLFSPSPQVVAFRDGSGVQGDRVWLSGSGANDGQCHGASDCSDLASEIADELNVSDTVVRYGLWRDERGQP
jgi:lipoteichoic acid synthase